MSVTGNFSFFIVHENTGLFLPEAYNMIWVFWWVPIWHSAGTLGMSTLLYAVISTLETQGACEAVTVSNRAVVGTETCSLFIILR